MAKLYSEEDVKKLLHIDDFRSIKKSQIIEFVSSIPKMDKDVAIKCIEQFPHFKETSEVIVGQLYEQYNNLVSIAQEGHMETIRAYKTILDDLHMMLERDDLSLSESRAIIEQEVEVADKIASLEKAHRSFIHDVLNKATAVASLAIAATATILGVNFLKK